MIRYGSEEEGETEVPRFLCCAGTTIEEIDRVGRSYFVHITNITEHHLS